MICDNQKLNCKKNINRRKKWIKSQTNTWKNVCIFKSLKCFPKESFSNRTYICSMVLLSGWPKEAPQTSTRLASNRLHCSHISWKNIVQFAFFNPSMIWAPSVMQGKDQREAGSRLITFPLFFFSSHCLPCLPSKCVTLKQLGTIPGPGILVPGVLPTWFTPDLVA